ncbi:MAG: hypothetical protein Q9182_005633 [Xanthomendoza sp. 2 TL-2023]
MESTRYVRFAFEPMILHIATASLTHAAPILSAAISAGFRESGVQSLKNLTDPNALPMVAVRSAGLAFESVIGVIHTPLNPPQALHRGDLEDEQEQQEDKEGIAEALVDENYLEMLVDIANERFEANTERIRRFEEALFGKAGTKSECEWEDRATRNERKRREGLARREEMRDRDKRQDARDGDAEDKDVMVGGFEDVTCARTLLRTQTDAAAL